MTETPAIIIASAEVISEMEEIEKEFFRNVLNMDSRKVLTTDESCLSDFLFSGIRPGMVIPEGDYKVQSKWWKDWVVSETCRIYGIEPFDPHIYLVDLFKMLEGKKADLTPVQ